MKCNTFVKSFTFILMRRKIHVSSINQKTVPSNLKGKGVSSQEWLTRQLNDPYVKKAQDMNYRARSAFKLIEIDDKAKILKPGQTVVECGASPGAWTQVIVKRINSDGKVSKKKVGTVIGIDLLPIAPLDGAILLGGCDFTCPKTQKQIHEILLSRRENKENAGDMTEMNKNYKNHERNTKSKILQSNDSGYVTDTTTAFNNETDGKLNENKTTPIKLGVDVVLSDMAPNATGQKDANHYRIMKLVESALVFAIENGNQGGHFLTKVWDGNELKKLEDCLGKYYEKVSRHKPPSSRNDSSEIFILGKFKK